MNFFCHLTLFAVLLMFLLLCVYFLHCNVLLALLFQVFCLLRKVVIQVSFLGLHQPFYVVYFVPSNLILLFCSSFFRNGFNSFAVVPVSSASSCSVFGPCFSRCVTKLLNTAVAFRSSILLCASVLFIIKSASCSLACKSFKNPVNCG